MMQMQTAAQAEELLKKAILEIDTTGSTSLGLKVNKRKQSNSDMYLVEVGLDVVRATKNPSNETIIRLKRNDDLLKVVDRYLQKIAI